jgi:hypothetical protein
MDEGNRLTFRGASLSKLLETTTDLFGSPKFTC